jgi:two-component system, response regulator
MNSPNEIEILLIEDNPNDAELAIRALRKNYPDRNILHLLDGEEAISYFFPNGIESHEVTQKLPKVILLDLKLPRVDGFEVLKIIKSHISTRLLPVVILSSSAEKIDIQKCYAMGANSYIVKPVDFDSYRDTVANIGHYWLNNNQPLLFESS